MDKDLSIKIGKGKKIAQLEKEPFVRQHEEKKVNTFTIRITDDLLEWFELAKRIIRQPKNSTAMKQLAKIGYMHVLHDEKIKGILMDVLENSRRNQRMGITDSEYKVE